MSVRGEVEYSQISQDWRHRDNLTWQIPSIIVVIGGALITAAFALKIDPKYFRPNEVDQLLGDSSKAREELGWKPSYTFNTLIDDMMEYELSKV